MLYSHQIRLCAPIAVKAEALSPDDHLVSASRTFNDTVYSTRIEVLTAQVEDRVIDLQLIAGPQG